MGKIFGILSLICGILGLAVPIVGLRFPGLAFGSIILPILAIIFGAIGIAKDDSKALGVVGLVLGVIGLVIWIVLIILVFILAIGLFGGLGGGVFV